MLAATQQEDRMSNARDRLSGSSRRGFLVASSALLATGCFGSFGATNALYDWNKGVSSSKWLQWLVFLVLIILPVYGLFILADALVINTIEFFSGRNPIGGGTADLGNGHTLRSSRTEDPNLVKHEILEDGELKRTVYVRRLSDHEMVLLDEHMKPSGRARILPDGAVELLDAEGRVLSTVRPKQVRRATAALSDGAGPSQAVADVLDADRREALLASAR
jgi:hypothetical protein